MEMPYLNLPKFIILTCQIESDRNSEFLKKAGLNIYHDWFRADLVEFAEMNEELDVRILGSGFVNLENCEFLNQTGDCLLSRQQDNAWL